MLGEEIIFNFDNLIFLRISIGNQVCVLVRACLYLGEKVKKGYKGEFSTVHVSSFHIALTFWPEVSCKVINLKE